MTPPRPIAYSILTGKRPGHSGSSAESPRPWRDPRARAQGSDRSNRAPSPVPIENEFIVLSVRPPRARAQGSDRSHRAPSPVPIENEFHSLTERLCRFSNENFRVVLSSLDVQLDHIDSFVGLEKGHFDADRRKTYAFFSLFLGKSTAWMLGRTPPCAIVTPDRSLFSSSSLRMASCR